jgi:hypothetical protein
MSLVSYKLFTLDNELEAHSLLNNANIRVILLSVFVSESVITLNLLKKKKNNTATMPDLYRSYEQMNLMTVIFWDIASCSLVEMDRPSP